MNYKKAVDIANAITLISKELDDDGLEHTLSIIAMFMDRKKLNEVMDMYKEFISADLEERGRMFGIEVTVNE